MGDEGEAFVWKKKRRVHDGPEDAAQRIERNRRELEGIQLRRQAQEERIRNRELLRTDQVEEMQRATRRNEATFQHEQLHHKHRHKLDPTHSLGHYLYALCILHTQPHTLPVQEDASTASLTPQLIREPPTPRLHEDVPSDLVGRYRIADSPFPVFLADISVTQIAEAVDIVDKFLQSLVPLLRLTELREAYVPEHEFWTNARVCLLGELRERQLKTDKLKAIEEPIVREYRALLGSAAITIKDVMDLQRLTALQLHYAADDEDIDVDYWEELERKGGWFAALKFIENVQAHISGSFADIQTFDPREVWKESDASAVLVDRMMAAVENLTERQADPNALFDQLVLRERAQLESGSTEVLEGGEYEPWHASGQPTKPRYFNRIKTVHEWHKYNQVHYDLDDPPPKTIQGYKFIICYPNLSASQKPRWSILNDPLADDNVQQLTADTQNTVILRFSAPGYKDLAFRIIKKEWDLLPRNGYRNVYEDNILVLSFTFKRSRYRK